MAPPFLLDPLEPASGAVAPDMGPGPSSRGSCRSYAALSDDVVVTRVSAPLTPSWAASLFAFDGSLIPIEVLM